MKLTTWIKVKPTVFRPELDRHTAPVYVHHWNWGWSKKKAKQVAEQEALKAKRILDEQIVKENAERELKKKELENKYKEIEIKKNSTYIEILQNELDKEEDDRVASYKPSGNVESLLESKVKADPVYPNPYFEQNNKV